MAKKNSPEQRKKEARRALILFIAATALFAFSLIHFFRVEG